MALSRAEFVDLVDGHAPALYRLAYRLVGNPHDAEDMVQETFRSAWTSRVRFDSNRGARAWLASILRRRVIDRWRKRGGREMRPCGDSFDVAAPPVDPTADGLTDEMQHALSELSDELRDSLMLVVVDELTHRETAEALGVPLGTILSRVSRARKRMRRNLRGAPRSGVGS